MELDRVFHCHATREQTDKEDGLLDWPGGTVLNWILKAFRSRGCKMQQVYSQNGHIDPYCKFSINQHDD